MQSLNTADISLFLVDDHTMFREGLAHAIEKRSGFQIVGQAGSSTEALSVLDDSGARIVLLDVDLGPERALDFVVESKKRNFPGKILIVTAGITGQEAVQLVQAGVAGIIHKHHSIDKLCETIRTVAAGEVFLEEAYFTALYHSVDGSRIPKRPALTDRDKVVLRFILQGLSNRDIGVRLKISEGGVKSALRQLFDKLGVRTRGQLVRIALEQYRDEL